MRADTIGLVKQAVAEQRHAYVLVNEPLGGHAPLTIQALVDRLQADGVKLGPVSAWLRGGSH